MSRRPFHLLLIAWIILWFSAVMPGHRIGMVQAPGSTRALGSGLSMGYTLSAGGMSCCTPGESESPAPLPRASCAICQIFAKVDAPVMVVLTTPMLGLIDRLPRPAERLTPSVEPISTHQGRAPPVAAA